MPTGYRVTLGNAAIDPGDGVSNSATTSFTTSQVLGPGEVTWTNGSFTDTVSGTFYFGSDGEVYFVPDTAPDPNAMGGVASVATYTGSQPNLNSYDDSDGTDDGVITTGDGNDTIRGGVEADGVGGQNSDTTNPNDTINSGGGDDVIYGGIGDDSIDAGTGNDSIIIEDGFGSDTINGGTGRDSIEVATSGPVTITHTGNSEGTLTDGTDTLSFSGIESFTLTNGNDSVDASLDSLGVEVIAMGGNDTVIGGSGNDTIDGHDGANSLSGGDGGDIIYDAGGNDTIDGGAGNDTIYIGAGDDSVFGGTGSDRFEIQSGFGTDTIDAGVGDVDSLQFRTVNAAVNVSMGNLNAGTVTSGPNSIAYTSIESFSLTDFDDTFDALGATQGATVYGYAGSDTITGTMDSDRLNGGSDNDSIYAHEGNDTLYGEMGDDALFGGIGSDSIFGGIGSDSIFGGDDDDYLDGGGDNDTIEANRGADTVVGGLGDDVLSGGAGNDQVFGQEGNDTISGDDNEDQLYGGQGDDTFIVGENSGNDTIVGGNDGETVGDTIDFDSRTTGVTVNYSTNSAGLVTAGTDTLTFSEIAGMVLTDQDDVVFALNNTDDVTFNAGAGNDSIVTADGNDTLIGGDGDDTLQAGAGNDSLVGGLGTNQLEGGDGADTLDGTGGGYDYATYIRSDSAVNVDLSDGLTESGGEAQGDTLIGIEQIDGSQFNDTITADNSGMELKGWGGDDTITGGTGSDRIVGGEGNDTLTGGVGDDVFVVENNEGNDVITDFDVGDSNSDGFTNDQLDVSRYFKADGITPIEASDVVVSDDGSGNALLTFPGGETVVLKGVTPAQMTGQQNLYSAGVPCFVPGTTIETPEGPKAVETLRAGDSVLTKDNGAQSLVWTGRQTIGTSVLRANPNIRPIELHAGALGNDAPLRVSPQHCFVVGSDHGFADESFVRAKHLAETPLARVIQSDLPVQYIHILCSSHQVVVADGIETETFYPGPQSLKMLQPQDVMTLLRNCPSVFEEGASTSYGPRARAVLRRKDVLAVFGSAISPCRTHRAIAAK